MNFYNLALKNILNFPLICFSIGVLAAFAKPGFKLPNRINKFLTVYILFCIGLKGGGPLVDYAGSFSVSFAIVLCSLIAWGLVQPVLSFYLLKAFVRIDHMTAAAIAASFGSVSVMTFVTAMAFLEQRQVGYQELTVVALAILEIPAIISGVFLAKIFDPAALTMSSLRLSKIFFESIVNKAILSIVLGLIVGATLCGNHLIQICSGLMIPFKSLLCLFLLDMGLHIGSYRGHFRSFSWSLSCFGIYMPLIGGCFGLFLSYIFGLNVGTGTLIATLAASASYIAVPAAMRIAIPQAKEAIYLPLSLGVAFPFNVVIGIPLYYYFANELLS